MAENKLADMSTEFAVKILNLTDSIKGHYSLANQLERSVTSIGANTERRSMLPARRILLQNCKYPSKSVMKRNIGLRLHKRQVSFQKMLQKVFCTIAVQSAEC